MKKKESLSLLFCISFSVLFLIFNTNTISLFFSSIHFIETKILDSFDAIGSFFIDNYDKISNYKELEKKCNSCLSSLDKYKLLLKDIEILEKENTTLRNILDFSPKISYPNIKAEVLSVRLNTLYPIIIISKGKNSGILPYMPVLSQATDIKGELIEAVLGKIIQVKKNYSVVQPIINQNFTIGVKTEDNLWSILSGNSKDLFTVVLTYIDDRAIIDTKNLHKNKNITEKLSSDYFKSVNKINKPVFSSGGAGVFPPNLPVGIIIKEIGIEGNFKKAYVKPYVNLKKIKYVTIIQKLPEEWKNFTPEEKYTPKDILHFDKKD